MSDVMTTSEAGMKCKECGEKLSQLNPPVEDYLENKFCLNLFGWKLILLKDTINMGCVECLHKNQQGRERDNFKECQSFSIGL